MGYQDSDKPGKHGEFEAGTPLAGHVYVMLHSSEILQEPVEYVLEDLYSSSAPQVSSCFRLRWSSLLHLISTGPAHLYAMLTNSLLSYADPSAAQELKDEAERKIRALQAS